MIPIDELLNRIRWDEEFGTGRFEIGYMDHVAQKIVRVPFREIRFEPGNHFAFELLDSLGEPLMIPFHRVREVYKNGELIWRRPS